MPLHCSAVAPPPARLPLGCLPGTVLPLASPLETYLGVTTTADCRTLCASDEECIASVHNITTDTCALFSSIANVSTCPGGADPSSCSGNVILNPQGQTPDMSITDPSADSCLVQPLTDSTNTATDDFQCLPGWLLSADGGVSGSIGYLNLYWSPSNATRVLSVCLEVCETESTCSFVTFTVASSSTGNYTATCRLFLQPRAMRGGYSAAFAPPAPLALNGSYVPGTPRYALAQTCFYIAPSWPALIPSPGLPPAVPLGCFPDISISGSLIGYAGGSPNLAQCRRLCDSSPQCALSVYDSAASRCYLSSSPVVGNTTQLCNLPWNEAAQGITSCLAPSAATHTTASGAPFLCLDGWDIPGKEVYYGYTVVSRAACLADCAADARCLYVIHITNWTSNGQDGCIIKTAPFSRQETPYPHQVADGQGVDACLLLPGGTVPGR